MYNIKEACSLTDLSYDTLKYCCNIGLIPNVKSDKNNYRVFDDDINFINGLVYLRKCGMSIKR